MQERDIESVRDASNRLARPLIAAFASMVENRDASRATVTMIDVCCRVLSVAIMPLNEEGRRKALDLMVRETLEMAEDNDGSFAAFTQADPEPKP